MKRPLLAALTVALIVGGIAATATAATADDDPGIGLTVIVSPAPSTSTPAPSTSSGPIRTGGGGSTTPTDVAPAPTPTADPEEYSLGGLLYVSGLSSHGQWAVNPAGTTAILRMTVRNASSTVVQSKATFWVEGPLANQLGTERIVQIRDLKPGETRVVTATMTGLGQWTFLHGHTTFTPPKKLEGTALEPITRDQYFVVFPWVLVVALIAGAAAYLIVRIVRSRHPEAGT